MLSASLYIIVCSAKNRLAMRLRRLREPRYLIGAIVGAAYFYFAVFRRMGGGRSTDRRGRPSISPSVMLSVYGGAAGFAGTGLLLMAALAWIFPADRGLLAFSEAEIHLLLPAPMTRRQLLVHRLLRSQLPLLFGAVVSALFVPLASGARLRFGIGMFIVLVTARIYFIGVTLSRARLGASRATERRLAWAPLALLLSAVAVVVISILRAYRSMPVGTFAGVSSSVGLAIGRGPAALAVWPFAAVVRPLFAGSYAQFLSRLPGALAVLAVIVEWYCEAPKYSSTLRIPFRGRRSIVRGQAELCAPDMSGGRSVYPGARKRCFSGRMRCRLCAAPACSRGCRLSFRRSSWPWSAPPRGCRRPARGVQPRRLR